MKSDTLPLPCGWIYARLGEIGAWTGGGTPSKGDARFWEDGTIPWVSPKDVKVPVLYDAEDHITPAALSASATKLVPRGSALVVMRSGILRHSLPVAVNAVSVALNQDLKAITPHVGIDVVFLVWAVRRFESEILYKCAKAGTTVQSIETPELQQFEIPLPPLAEQRRIVAALEEHLSDLDAAVAGLERVQANIGRFRAAVLDAAVSGSLAGVQSHRGELPEGWVWSTLGDIADVQGGIQKQPKRAPTANHYPFLRVANVHRGRLVLDEVHRIELFGNELKRLRLEPGDLLIVEGNGSPGEIGRMAVWDGSISDCVHQNHIIRARPRPVAHSEFLAIYWNSPQGMRLVQAAASSTSGLHTLSVAKVSRIPVPLPPLNEQQAIVAEVERRLSVANRFAAEIDVQLARAARLRQSILKRAFEGKLVPQDPADEPATVLLERIRAEHHSGNQPARRSHGRSRQRQTRSR